jgi:hypothetical protein
MIFSILPHTISMITGRNRMISKMSNMFQSYLILGYRLNVIESFYFLSEGKIILNPEML